MSHQVVLRLFDRDEDADNAIRDLSRAGVARGDIKLMMNGADGAADGLAGSGVSNNDAALYQEALRRGGRVVSARVHPDLVPKADEILGRNAVDPVARRAEYAAEGWSSYDPAGPLTTAADRDRRGET